MAWIQDKFNSWFGSNITYVANAYAGTKYIRVFFHRNDIDFKRIALGARNREVNVDIVLENNKETESVRLAYDDPPHQKRRTDGFMMMSIFPEHEDGILDKSICENYQISPNRSFIVTKSGSLAQQKYGGDLWEDCYGNDHRPR